MKKVLFILFAYFCLPYFGGMEGGCQPNRDKYRDKVWMFGYGGNNTTLDPNFGLTKLIFNENNIDTVKVIGSARISAVSTSLCDTVGNLIAYSNGLAIYNKLNQISRHLDSIGMQMQIQ